MLTITNELDRIKFKVQLRVVLTSVILLGAKVLAYFLTDSIGILTDALESIVNVLTGFISLYSINIALKPKDANHPFGHGKIEMLSASVEGLLILMAGLIIIYEAIVRLFSPSMPEKLDIGILLVGVSGVINYLLGWYSINVGKKHNSIALVAGGKHLQSDTYSSIGLVIGLILLFITKVAWIDSLIALAFGSIIIYTGYKILKETTSNLMDESDFVMLEKLTNILWENQSKYWIEIHNVKLVKYGESHHIDCDLTVPWYMTVKDAHVEADNLKKAIKSFYSEVVDLNVHTDQCKEVYCYLCNVDDCIYRRALFEKREKWTLNQLISNKSTLQNIEDSPQKNYDLQDKM